MPRLSIADVLAVPVTGGGRAHAHSARLGAGDELVGRPVLTTEVEVLDRLLGDHYRDHLGVGDRAVRSNDQVDAGGEQFARLTLEDGGPERPPGPVADVEARELDREPHPILDGRVDAIRKRLPHPVRETQRDLGEPHDGAPLTGAHDSRSLSPAGGMLELGAGVRSPDLEERFGNQARETSDLLLRGEDEE